MRHIKLINFKIKALLADNDKGMYRRCFEYVAFMESGLELSSRAAGRMPSLLVITA